MRLLVLPAYPIGSRAERGKCKRQPRRDWLIQEAADSIPTLSGRTSVESLGIRTAGRQRSQLAGFLREAVRTGDFVSIGAANTLNPAQIAQLPCAA